MPTLILFNKPYNVLSQFTGSPGQATLKDWIHTPHVYPAGRLDADSEGLLLLTDYGPLQAHIADPRHKMPKRYLAQIEGIPNQEALNNLQAGLNLGDFQTQACKARLVPPPNWLWARTPPIRYRANIPTQWLEIELREGKNRQVRRMTAKIGHPTLRLIRYAIGNWTLDQLPPGQSKQISITMPKQTIARHKSSINPRFQK